MTRQIKHYCKDCGEDYTDEYNAADCKDEICAKCRVKVIKCNTQAQPVQDYMLDRILRAMEEYREKFHYCIIKYDEKENPNQVADFVIRQCEAIVAEKAGYKDRNDWKHLQKVG